MFVKHFNEMMKRNHNRKHCCRPFSRIGSWQCRLIWNGVEKLSSISFSMFNGAQMSVSCADGQSCLLFDFWELLLFSLSTCLAYLCVAVNWQTFSPIRAFLPSGVVFSHHCSALIWFTPSQQSKVNWVEVELC